MDFWSRQLECGRADRKARGHIAFRKERRRKGDEGTPVVGWGAAAQPWLADALLQKPRNHQPVRLPQPLTFIHQSEWKEATVALLRLMRTNHPARLPGDKSQDSLFATFKPPLTFSLICSFAFSCVPNLISCK